MHLKICNMCHLSISAEPGVSQLADWSVYPENVMIDHNYFQKFRCAHFNLFNLFYSVYRLLIYIWEFVHTYNPNFHNMFSHRICDRINLFNPLAAEFFLLPSYWHEDNLLLTCTWHGVYSSKFTVFWYSCFPGWELNLHPYLQHRESVYTQFLKEIQFSLFCTKHSIDKVINISFCLSKVGCPVADLSTICGTIVESSRPIYWPSMPIRQVFWADLSANRSQRVKLIIHY